MVRSSALATRPDAHSGCLDRPLLHMRESGTRMARPLHICNCGRGTYPLRAQEGWRAALPGHRESPRECLAAVSTRRETPRVTALEEGCAHAEIAVRVRRRQSALPAGASLYDATRARVRMP